MTPTNALQQIIQPPLNTMLGVPFPSLEAETMLLAIGLQESGFATRVQHHGPAHGFWQFEKGGGVHDFVIHGDHRIQEAVRELGWELNTQVLYDGLATIEGDHMAVMLARDLLYQYPHPLPALSDIDEGWKQYLALWRPGKPSRARWDSVYAQALRTVRFA
jgi:hypothetical protein